MTERTTVATIGESIVFKGELSGDEDLVIDGQVEGKIDLNQNDARRWVNIGKVIRQRLSRRR